MHAFPPLFITKHERNNLEKDPKTRQLRGVHVFQRLFRGSYKGGREGGICVSNSDWVYNRKKICVDSFHRESDNRHS